MEPLSNRIARFLSSIPNIYNEDGRRAFILNANLDDALKSMIRYNPPLTEFCPLLVDNLINYGNLKDGKDALEAVLEAAKSLVGLDKKAECDNLIQAWRDSRQEEGIRKLLLEDISYEQLEYLCHYYYPEVYNKFTKEMPHSTKVCLLFEYCQRNHTINELSRHLTPRNSKISKILDYSLPRPDGQGIKNLYQSIEITRKKITDLEFKVHLCRSHPLPDLLQRLKIERDKLNDLKQQLEEQGEEWELKPLDSPGNSVAEILLEEVRRYSLEQILEKARDTVDEVRASYNPQLKEIENLYREVEEWKKLHHALHTLQFSLRMATGRIRQLTSYTKPSSKSNDLFPVLTEEWRVVSQLITMQVKPSFEETNWIKSTLCEAEQTHGWLANILSHNAVIESSIKNKNSDNLDEEARSLEHDYVNLFYFVDEQLRRTVENINNVFNRA